MPSVALCAQLKSWVVLRLIAIKLRFAPTAHTAPRVEVPVIDPPPGGDRTAGVVRRAAAWAVRAAEHVKCHIFDLDIWTSIEQPERGNSYDLPAERAYKSRPVTAKTAGRHRYNSKKTEPLRR